MTNVMAIGVTNESNDRITQFNVFAFGPGDEQLITINLETKIFSDGRDEHLKLAFRKTIAPSVSDGEAVQDASGDNTLMQSGCDVTDPIDHSIVINKTGIGEGCFLLR